MARILVVNHISLDGVMQAPARPDEDPRDGFVRGGWATAGSDEVMGRVMAERMARGSGGGLLLGRRTYQDLHRVWAHRDDHPYSAALNRSRKYVVSNTLADPLAWANSTRLAGDAADSVGDLKGRCGGDLTILGSGRLIHALFRHGLIDEYLLMIHPLVLGGGLRLFPGQGAAALRLRDAVTTTRGVVIASYAATG